MKIFGNQKARKMTGITALSMLALFRMSNFYPVNANAQGFSLSYTTTAKLQTNAPHFLLTSERLPTI